jgi:hypothetical protein
MASLSGDNPPPDEMARRVAWFHDYVDRLANQPSALPLRCPCCRCKTLGSRGDYQICSVCFWEDDGQDNYDADHVRGGPNGRLSLTEARRNYQRLGACDERSLKHVRSPRPEELPDAEADTNQPRD